MKTLLALVGRFASVPAVVVALLAFAALPVAHAQPQRLFQGADLAMGEKLMAEHRCSACHARKVGGDGSAIYRPMGKINTAGLLRGNELGGNHDIALTEELAALVDRLTAVPADIPYLVITDLDSVGPTGRAKTCRANEPGARTSNASLKKLCGKETVADLIAMQPPQGM